MKIRYKNKLATIIEDNVDIRRIKELEDKGIKVYTLCKKGDGEYSRRW